MVIRHAIPIGWIVLSFSILVLGGLLAACSTTGAPGVSTAIADTPTPADIPAATGVETTPTLSWPEVHATRYAWATEATQNRAIFLTQIVLSPPPTYTPGRLPAVPTETPELGIHICARETGASRFPGTCWRGWVNGELLDIKAGVGEPGSDQTQGIVWVVREVPWPPEFDDSVPKYNTPQRVGPVQIVAVDGLRFTIAPMNPQYQITFVFDLATRQWEVPPPSPVPSLAPVPTP